jgi:hypothetical protein
MLDERTIHLINANIDGELEAGEREALEAILESSAEARAMKAELLRISNLLDSLPEQSPPAHLSQQILNQFAPPPGGVAGFSLAGFFASFQPATAGLAFAAGLLLTVGFYEMSPGRESSSDTASMVGTMVASQPGGPQFLKNDMSIKGDGFSGTVSLRENEGIYVLNFDLDSEEKTGIEVGLEHTGLSFGGFAEIQGDADKVFNSVAISGGTLHVVNQGRQQFAVFLRENSSDHQAVDAGSITIGFSRDGGRLQGGVPDSQ